MKRLISYLIILAITLTVSAPVEGITPPAQTQKVTKTGKKKSTAKKSTKKPSAPTAGKKPAAAPAPQPVVPPRPGYTLQEQPRRWETGLIVSNNDVFFFNNRSCSYRKAKNPGKHVRTYQYKFDKSRINLTSDVDELNLDWETDYNVLRDAAKGGKPDYSRVSKTDFCMVYDYFPFDPETAYCGINHYFVHQGKNWIEVRPLLYRGVWAQYVTTGEDKNYYYIGNDRDQLRVPKKITDGSRSVEKYADNGVDLTGVVRLYAIVDTRKSRRQLDVDTSRLITADMSRTALNYHLLSLTPSADDLLTMSTGHLIFAKDDKGFHTMFFTRDGKAWKHVRDTKSKKSSDWYYGGHYEGYHVFRDFGGDNIYLLHDLANRDDGRHIEGMLLTDAAAKALGISTLGEFNTFTSSGSHIISLSKVSNPDVRKYIVKNGYTYELYGNHGLEGRFDLLDPNAGSTFVAEGDNGTLNFEDSYLVMKINGIEESMSAKDYGFELDTNRPLIAGTRMKNHKLKKEKEERERLIAEKKRKDKEAREERERKRAEQKRKMQQRQQSKSTASTTASSKASSSKSGNSGKSGRLIGAFTKPNTNAARSGSQSTTTRQSAASSSRSSTAQTRTWREELGYGGFVICTEFANGCIQRTRYRLCPNCRGAKSCANCYGSGACPLCQGRGGIISAGYGNFYPCGACGQSGRCGICKGSGRCLCNSLGYPGYAIGSTSVITPDGQAIRSVAEYNGRSSSSENSSGSSGSSNSSRYGYYDCPTCYGTGTCQTCGGDSHAEGYTAGGMLCPNCYGNYTHKRADWGRCSVCKGTGKKYGVK